jgi:hypothetical protein
MPDTARPLSLGADHSEVELWLAGQCRATFTVSESSRINFNT